MSPVVLVALGRVSQPLGSKPVTFAVNGLYSGVSTRVVVRRNGIITVVSTGCDVYA